MYTGKLCKVGDSIMVAIPPTMLDQLRLEAGATLSMDLEGDHLVLSPHRLRYTLDELLSQCDFSQPISAEDQEWLDAPAVGRELL